jgi:hypothetical protein
MKHNYKENDIITYPVPGVVFNKPDNTIDTKARIVKIYDSINLDTGVIVDMELVESKIKITGKLLYNKKY